MFYNSQWDLLPIEVSIETVIRVQNFLVKRKGWRKSDNWLDYVEDLL